MAGKHGAQSLDDKTCKVQIGFAFSSCQTVHAFTYTGTATVFIKLTKSPKTLVLERIKRVFTL